MNINITDRIASEFLSGMIAILVLLAVGALLSYILRGMAKKLPFTRLALILALAPLSLIQSLDHGAGTSLLLYSMVITVLGVAIDGINHLLLPKERLQETESMEEQEEEAAEPKPGMIVWEKAE